MKYMYRYILCAMVFGMAMGLWGTAVAQIPAAELVPDTRSEISVTKDGVTRITGFKILQRAGNSFFGRLYWGDTYLRVSVRTNSRTALLSRFGEKLEYDNFQIGDVLSAEGALLSGTSEFSVNATKLTHVTYGKNAAQFTGAVLTVSPATASFQLATRTDILTVHTSSTTVVHKGSRYETGSLKLLEVGDRILRVTGVYDYAAKSLEALDVTAFSDAALLKPQAWQGTLVNTPAAGASTLEVMIKGKPMTIRLNARTQIITEKRKATTIGRFQAGDALSLYGAREEAALSTIAAEVVRNLDL